jgi:hypothetical protein
MWLRAGTTRNGFANQGFVLIAQDLLPAVRPFVRVAQIAGGTLKFGQLGIWLVEQA